VTTFGNVEQGTVVRVCSASRGDVLSGVKDAMLGLAFDSLGFTPSAAIIVSCAGRKWLLADRGEKELAASLLTAARAGRKSPECPPRKEWETSGPEGFITKILRDIGRSGMRRLVRAIPIPTSTGG
jgi:hypothetical protein